MAQSVPLSEARVSDIDEKFRYKSFRDEILGFVGVSEEE